jgi:hypothetical protein
MSEVLNASDAFMIGVAVGALGLSFVTLCVTGVAVATMKTSPPYVVPPWQPQAPFLKKAIEDAGR